MIKLYNALVWPHFTFAMQTLGSLDWLPLEKLLKQREVIMTFKALTSRSLRYLEKLFPASQNDNYNLRRNETKSKLLKPKTIL